MNLIGWFLELLYPTRCAFCHKLIRKNGEKVCADCLRKLPYVPLPAQKQCFPHVESCFSPLYYEGDVRASLLRYKFSSLTGYAEIYADFLAKCIDENQVICDSITWVPISRRRLRRRGYDQARLLAEELARRTGLPCERSLIKIRDNPPQSRIKTAAQRRANVAGAYKACPSAEHKGRHWLLIDDIVTTGSTLSECAGVLLEAGAASVSAAALARSKR
ncbi:MAG: ComF family protein [Oscillospiraceae bacterium]|nr:ComF family protein [Oscillospiraceae bacterium]